MKKIFLLLLIFVSIAGFARADSLSDKNVFVFSFHLYYDNGQLFANRDVKNKYDVLSSVFSPETISTTKPFKGEISAINGRVLDSFAFDPQKGDPSFKKGMIDVRAPYFADAKGVNFYNEAGQKLLSLDLTETSYCNDDGVCNADIGENFQTCPNDCPKPTPAVEETTTTIPPQKSGLSFTMIWLIILAVVIIAVFAIKLVMDKKKAGGEQLPPSPPPPAAPQS